MLSLLAWPDYGGHLLSSLSRSDLDLRSRLFCLSVLDGSWQPVCDERSGIEMVSLWYLH